MIASYGDPNGIRTRVSGALHFLTGLVIMGRSRREARKFRQLDWPDSSETTTLRASCLKLTESLNLAGPRARFRDRKAFFICSSISVLVGLLRVGQILDVISIPACVNRHLPRPVGLILFKKLVWSAGKSH